jgi:hypothetical protein
VKKEGIPKRVQVKNNNNNNNKLKLKLWVMGYGVIFMKRIKHLS